MYVETRATKWAYFPGPVFVLLIVLILDYSALAATRSWTQDYLSNDVFHKIPSPYLGYSVDLLFLITLLVLIWIAVRWVRWIRKVYAVTNHRVMVKRGIASRDVDDVPMTQVRGVDADQTVGERILGYGTIRISAEPGAATSIGNEAWTGIPKPFRVQRIIETVMQNPGIGAPPTAPSTTVVYAAAPPYGGPPSSPPSSGSPPR